MFKNPLLMLMTFLPFGFLIFGLMNIIKYSHSKSKNKLILSIVSFVLFVAAMITLFVLRNEMK